MKDKKAEEIALFRYGIISSIFNEPGMTQKAYFIKMSKKEHEVPHLGRSFYKPATFKSWLRRYRQGGFNALMPKARLDKGKSRKIDEHLGGIIKEKYCLFPSLSASGVYRLLIAEGDIEPGSICEGTIRKYIADHKLRMFSQGPVPRKRFEREHINELWMADSLHGPCLFFEGKQRKTYLISVIDDFSRVIVGAGFFFHETSLSLEIVLKEAIGRFGAPKALYCDNGSMFISTHLQLACARLGIALIHSKPYDSPARGKIERYNRTVRQRFLSLLDLSSRPTLDELNSLFIHWLGKEYQKGFHHGINTQPLDRWMDDLRLTQIRRVSSEELDQAFYISLTRRVKNDSTVSIQGTLYEVPHRFIGKTIEIRYPADDPHNLTIYEENKAVGSAKRLNPHENASTPALGIRFYHQGDHHDRCVLSPQKKTLCQGYSP